MTEIQLKQWEAEASEAARDLCGRLADMSTDGLHLDLIDAEAANGSNSLDNAFLERLENGDHLTDDFLAAI
ncbi:hypothetical protein WG901_10110 [Novosphingobium sp. PS1R-30]|uniref:Uncharacterized protein n=1 Tax=Novosphingobium anseongense TaxID=3133436 RepID=A0ABU8RVE4_9SPHN